MLQQLNDGPNFPPGPWNHLNLTRTTMHWPRKNKKEKKAKHQGGNFHFQLDVHE